MIAGGDDKGEESCSAAALGARASISPRIGEDVGSSRGDDEGDESTACALVVALVTLFGAMARYRLPELVVVWMEAVVRSTTIQQVSRRWDGRMCINRKRQLGT
jgi:hypothetical protein